MQVPKRKGVSHRRLGLALAQYGAMRMDTLHGRCVSSPGNGNRGVAVAGTGQPPAGGGAEAAKR